MSWKKRIAIALSAVALVAAFTGCGSQGGNGDGKYKVGIVQLVEHPALDAANKGFIDGLKSQGLADKVDIDQQNAQADQSNLNTIAQRFVADKKDLVLAIATPAAQTMANATKTIPILGTAITDYEAAKLVKNTEKPGGNVSGTSDINPINQQIDLLLAIKPNAKKIGTIYSSSEVNSQLQVERMKAYAVSKGLQVVEVTVSNVNDIPQAAQNLISQGVAAVYTPTDNTVASAMTNLTGILTEAKIPVIGSEDNQVKNGALACYSVDYYKLGYQTGIMAAKVLEGKAKVGDLPIEKQDEYQLVFNKDTLQKLGLTVPPSLEKQAKLI